MTRSRRAGDLGHAVNACFGRATKFPHAISAVLGAARAVEETRPRLLASPDGKITEYGLRGSFAQTMRNTSAP